MNRFTLILSAIILVAPGCVSQKMIAAFEKVEVRRGVPAVDYNFAYAMKKGSDEAKILMEKSLVPEPWTDGEVIMKIPGEMFEVEPVGEGPVFLINTLLPSDAEVLWVDKKIPLTEAAVDQDGNWIGTKHYWDIAYDMMIEAYDRQSELGADYSLVAVEPSYSLENPRYQKKVIKREELLEISSDTQGANTTAKGPSWIWPGRGISWHLGRDYSQLADARDALLADVHSTPVVRIAHLDTGYFPGDRLKPTNMFIDESMDFIKGGTGKGDVPGTASSHGARTLSTLAGARATVADGASGSVIFDAEIGAFPEVPVAEYRISKKLPIHLNAGRMAKAISTAVDNGYDVVSISAGGLPSLAQRDAVNKAYNKGTAIIAATGDFFTLPVLGYSTPKTVVFPARYNRVLGVAGVTASGKSYGLAPCTWCLLKFDEWGSWMLRGSYGPSSEMAGHTIAAYAPNITHSAGTVQNPNAIALTGAGTSHATPQVAAAAAMWLEYHRDELQDVWHDWQKTEAVYTALLRSAKHDSKYYSVETMGAGTLKALDALNTRVDLQSLCERTSSTIGLQWIKDAVFSTGLLHGIKEQLAAFIKEMLFTELQQVMFGSQDVADILEKLNFAREAGGCEFRFSSTSPTVAPGDVRRLIAALPRERMSHRLREVLDARLRELPQ